MTEDTMARPHLDDHEILHLVDRDASAWEMDRWSHHVLECASCAERLATLRRRATRFSEALTEVQLPAGRTRPPLPARTARPRAALPVAAPRWMQAAAVLVLLLLPFAMVSPLRAWVSEQLASGWTRVSTLVDGRSTAAPLPAPQQAGSFTVRFTPASPDMQVRLATWQAAGELVVQRVEGAEGTVEVVGGATETPVISERGVSVGNTAGSTARYVVGVPGVVSTVEVWVGAERVDSLSGDRLPTTLDLGVGDRAP